MSKQYEEKNNQQVLVLNGSVVYASVAVLLEAGNVLLESSEDKSVVIDCEEVSRIDSAGIAMLVEWRRWCKNHKKKFKIEGLPEQAQSLIETYRLQQVLQGTSIT
jgi:phospholipid transport system transporter-binding protein